MSAKVERFRAGEYVEVPISDSQGKWVRYSDYEKLQSQLAQVTQERDRLRNALLPFALLDIRHLSDRPDHEPIWAINKSQITNGHIRTAARLLQAAADAEILL